MEHGVGLVCLWMRLVAGTLNVEGVAHLSPDWNAAGDAAGDAEDLCDERLEQKEQTPEYANRA